MQTGYAQRLLAMLAALALQTAQAQGAAREPAPAFKLTTGLYQYSGGAEQNGPAVDLNLRHTSAAGNLWLGRYVSWAQALTQDRLGWDHSFSVGAVRVVPALQLATAGAWNGSVGVETGTDWFTGAGLGRTNLRDSVSLNFDPNDSYSIAGGYRWNDVDSLSFLLVRDNRLHPDQQHLHLIYRAALPGAHRLTLDLLFKSGLLEGEAIERTGWSLTYDWPRWFLRLGYDPKVNFTPQDLWRLAVGARF